MGGGTSSFQFSSKGEKKFFQNSLGGTDVFSIYISNSRSLTPGGNKSHFPSDLMRRLITLWHGDLDQALATAI